MNSKRPMKKNVLTFHDNKSYHLGTYDKKIVVKKIVVKKIGG